MNGFLQVICFAALCSVSAAGGVYDDATSQAFAKSFDIQIDIRGPDRNKIQNLADPEVQNFQSHINDYVSSRTSAEKYVQFRHPLYTTGFTCVLTVKLSNTGRDLTERMIGKVTLESMTLNQDLVKLNNVEVKPVDGLFLSAGDKPYSKDVHGAPLQSGIDYIVQQVLTNKDVEAILLPLRAITKGKVYVGQTVVNGASGMFRYDMGEYLLIMIVVEA